MSDEMLQILRKEISELSASLPKTIDLPAVSSFKAPGKVLILRESLIWRAEEVSRNALVALDASDFVTAALLSRAMMETTSAVVFLHMLVSRAIESGFSAIIDEKLTDFLTGSKIWDDIGEAIHVNEMLREAEKILPGFFHEHYAMLSEFAHPNWSGTFGAFGITFEKDLMIKFARGGRSPESSHGIVAGPLAGSVGIFIGYYNDLADMITPFEKVVTAAYANEKDKVRRNLEPVIFQRRASLSGMERGLAT